MLDRKVRNFLPGNALDPLLDGEVRPHVVEFLPTAIEFFGWF